ncbi:hypothetical protein [Humidesulfovibrio idahonensis]
MREAWFVVEAYCATHVLLGMLMLRALLEHPQSAARFLCSLMVTLFLAFLTFKGVRIASRALAAVVAIIPTSLVWVSFTSSGEFTVYMAYGLVIAAYFVIGSVKLWRIMELPTRFTDPPTEEQAHH